MQKHDIEWSAMAVFVRLCMLVYVTMLEELADVVFLLSYYVD